MSPYLLALCAAVLLLIAVTCLAAIVLRENTPAPEWKKFRGVGIALPEPILRESDIDTAALVRALKRQGYVASPIWSPPTERQ